MRILRVRLMDDPPQPPLHPSTWSETGHTTEGGVDRALFDAVLARLDRLENENAVLKTEVAILKANAEERANVDPVAHVMRERGDDLCRRQAAVDGAKQKLEEAETQDTLAAQCRDEVVRATEAKQAKEAERDRFGEEYKGLLMEMEGSCTGYLDTLNQVMNDPANAGKNRALLRFAAAHVEAQEMETLREQNEQATVVAEAAAATARTEMEAALTAGGGGEGGTERERVDRLVTSLAELRNRMQAEEGKMRAAVEWASTASDGVLQVTVENFPVVYTMQRTGRAVVLKNAGYSATEVRALGYSATEVKQAGYSATEAKQVGFSATEAKQAGYSATEAKQAGYSATEAKQAGYSATELKPLCKVMDMENFEDARVVIGRDRGEEKYGRTVRFTPDRASVRCNGASRAKGEAPEAPPTGPGPLGGLMGLG